MKVIDLPLLQRPPLSLYVHIPWCVQKCPYCDFNSHALKQQIDEQAYVEALLSDLAQESANSYGRKLHSIFIGGGTPSLFSAQAITQLLRGIEAQIPFADDIEITLEANPGTVEAERFGGYVAAGVNRISIGVQSFQQQHLQRLGRIHDPQQAINAINIARQVGLRTFNLDLMHGLPDQTLQQALADLQQAVALGVPHISWYQLTIEPNTVFASRPPRLPDDEQLWQIYQQGHQYLTQAGYQQYETSAYARSEAHRARHNLNYWCFGDYIGIGCGAHGKITHQQRIERHEKIKHPKGYLAADDKNYRRWLVPLEEQAFEYFMNRLRLLLPCPKTEVQAFTQCDIGVIETQLHPFIEQGWLSDDGSNWQVTAQGALFVNDILSALLPDDED